MGQVLLADRIAGCLLGGACGDALGAPLEFLDSSTVAAMEPTSIARMLPAYKRQGGAITDDTQMTLFTVEALVELAARGDLDAREQLELVADAYLRWYETQTRRHRRSDTGLLADRRLFAQRAPGHTCMTALRKLAYDGELRATNDSKGCGTVMRAAPFGLVDRVDLAAPASDLTHGHPAAATASVALADMIRHLVEGATLPKAVDGAIAHLDSLDAPNRGATADALRAAVRLAGDGPPSQTAVESLGGAWVAEEALAIAVLCVLTGDGWTDTLVRAVAHGGDSDSTGAIAGNLLGATLGPADLPPEWLDRLEARSTIDAMAEQLTATVTQPPPPAPPLH